MTFSTFQTLKSVLFSNQLILAFILASSIASAFNSIPNIFSAISSFAKIIPIVQVPQYRSMICLYLCFQKFFTISKAFSNKFSAHFVLV
jgi:hypothetical protein